MNMFRDKEAMMALEQTGLIAMAKSTKTDPAVVVRVVDLIVNGPALPRLDQLSANGVDGKPFSLAERGFAAARREQLMRRRTSEGSAKDNLCSGLDWASRYSVTGYDLRMVRLAGEWRVG